MTDMVNHPPHYTQASPHAELIDLCETLPFTIGNAVKYIVRAKHKGHELEDYKKALWYLERYRDHGDVRDSTGPYSYDTKAVTMAYCLAREYDLIDRLFNFRLNTQSTGRSLCFYYFHGTVLDTIDDLKKVIEKLEKEANE